MKKLINMQYEESSTRYYDVYDRKIVGKRTLIRQVMADYDEYPFFKTEEDALKCERELRLQEWKKDWHEAMRILLFDDK
jgi:hypothetical protein